MSKIAVTTLFVIVFVCLTFEEASAACRDLESCARRASTQCHLPAVRNNCKNMCGVCNSPKRVVSRGVQNIRSRRPAAPIRSRPVPQRASPAAQARARKAAEARRRQMNQRRRNNPQQTQRQTCTDHPNCLNWARNGFCTSIYRTEAEKRSYCPNACKLCNKKTINNNPSNRRTRKPVVKPTRSVPAVTVAPSTEVPYALFQHSLNESVDPCTDFYQFACGRYQSENPATGGESFSRLIEHQHKLLCSEMKHRHPPRLIKCESFVIVVWIQKQLKADKTAALRTEMDKIGGGMPMLTSDPPKWDVTKFKLMQALIDINKLTSRNYFFDLDPYTDPKNGATSLCFKPMELLIKNPDDYTNAASKPKVDALKTFLAEIVDYLAQDMAAEKKTMTGIDFSTIQTAVDDLIALGKFTCQKNILNKIN
ncbi:Neprilysin-like protein [Aphelenchoides bicaudatus]|nr:Neprilysin-like protein [Aphelenchoides bicaudatus]